MYIKVCACLSVFLSVTSHTFSLESLCLQARKGIHRVPREEGTPWRSGLEMRITILQSLSLMYVSSHPPLFFHSNLDTEVHRAREDPKKALEPVVLPNLGARHG